MAYDRYDTRDERSRWSGEDRSRERDRHDDPRGRRDERGFFERAGDEIASWFGDDEAERRRHEDEMRDRRSEQGQRGRFSEQNRDFDRDRERERERSQGRGGDDRWRQNRGPFASGGSSERDYNRDWRQEYAGRDFNRERADRQPDRGWTDRYQPITGDYGRGSERGARYDERSQSPWGRDEYRGASRAGSANWTDKSREERSSEDRFDPHYHSWRDRHLSELDRDYDDYRAEHQSKFESDFGSWRERRQQKRSLLGQVRERMEVVGKDEKPVGTVERVAGDRLILSQPGSEGGAHLSLSCSDVDRIDGDRVLLDCSAEQARDRLRDESRSRALFEREDQGEMGPHALDRSFQGTYR